MEHTILIHTMYEENYGSCGRGKDSTVTDSRTEDWRNEGNHTFQIKIGSSILASYHRPAEVFQSMLDKEHNNNYERFTYVSNEVQLQTPTVIGTDKDYIKRERSLVF